MTKKNNNGDRLSFQGFDPIKRTVKGEKPITDFYVFKRNAPGEMPSYLSGSIYGRWMIGPAALVSELVILYDMDSVQWFLQDMEGPVTVIKNLGYDSQAEVAWRDLSGKVRIKE